MIALLAAMAAFMLWAMHHVHARATWQADEDQAEANIAAWRDSAGAAWPALLFAIACGLCIIIAASIWAVR